ncbi:MAG: hypothetical protein KDD66_05690 [Bdellovibrionales bacterium]|nr:hypothetical protein [Bdellovibrionales bacterium]
MSSSNYPYSSGALLDSPNSYMYTPFAGSEFLGAYFRSRNDFIEQIHRRLDNRKREVLPTLAVSQIRIEETHVELKSFFPSAGECPTTSCDSEILLLDSCLESGEFHTETILKATLKIAAHGRHKQAASWPQIVDALLRNIEVKRLIFEGYQKNLRRGIGDAKQLGNYCKLSAALALHFDREVDLRIMNALLKTNDIVSAIGANNLAAEDAEWALIGALVERTCAEMLLSAEGLKQ